MGCQLNFVSRAGFASASDFTSVRLGVQTLMSEEKDAPDLFDLKFLPAWLKEAPNENAYADFAGEEAPAPRAQGAAGRRREQRGPGGSRPPRDKRRAHESRGRERQPRRAWPRAAGGERSETPPAAMPAVEVRFVPDPRVLESVLGQIKAGHLAYSVFSLARMFLDKPERYNVRLKAATAELFQLGGDGQVAADRQVLENTAFANEKDRFYRTEVTQTEPIKGNFTSVARCRLSGVLLGPTNHHSYQVQLRNLYEQRFSRRMSFPEYQRQIEIVTNAEAVERWKEEARSVTSYVALQEEAPLTFRSAAEAERHFRQTYLPGLLHSGKELTLDGVVSRGLADRSLGKLIENAWAGEFRSPARMMQELSGAFRQGALQIFRHRKGMLFVSPIRARPLSQALSSLSPSIGAVLAALAGKPGLNRKQLLEELLPEGSGDVEEREKKKLALASDLHWLIHEGCVIEFNDGALDLPRVKAPVAAAASAENASANGEVELPVVPDEPQDAPLPSEAEAQLSSAPGVPEDEANLPSPPASG